METLKEIRTNDYRTPECESIELKIQNIICQSGTEHVGEDVGEW